MKAMQYPAQFTPEPEGGFTVTFRDIPEAITCGDDEAEAMLMAEDALLTVMEHCTENGRPMPAPSAPAPGERMVSIPDPA